jgi:hypothetical protein
VGDAKRLRQLEDASLAVSALEQGNCELRALLIGLAGYDFDGAF